MGVKMYIMPYKKITSIPKPLDLTQYEYRIVDVPLVTYDGSMTGFGGTAENAAELYSATTKETGIIPTKPDQPITAITDCLIIEFRNNGSTTLNCAWRSSEHGGASAGLVNTDYWVLQYDTSIPGYGIILLNPINNKYANNIFSNGDAYIPGFYVATGTTIVTGISLIAPPSATVGSLVNLTCKVYGEGGVDFAGFTASVSGNNVAETTIIDNDDTIYFSLFVGWEETAESLIVTVTSTQDPSVSTSKTISVIGDSGDDSGGDSGDGGDDSGGTGGGSDSGGGITPEGTLEITENGSYDVTEYASVEVNVPVPVADIKAAFWSGFGTAAALYGCGK